MLGIIRVCETVKHVLQMTSKCHGRPVTNCRVLTAGLLRHEFTHSVILNNLQQVFTRPHLLPQVLR